jgi:hypothetical protein
LLQQIVLLDESYHGGLQAYIRNAKQLLADSKEGEWEKQSPAGRQADAAAAAAGAVVAGNASNIRND